VGKLFVRSNKLQIVECFCRLTKCFQTYMTTPQVNAYSGLLISLKCAQADTLREKC